MTLNSLSISPNPFNPSTTINYVIPNNQDATLTILNLTGQVLLKRPIQGHGSYLWNARGLASGVYLSRVEWSGKVVTKTIVLTR